jgi:hypothetical protein
MLLKLHKVQHIVVLADDDLRLTLLRKWIVPTTGPHCGSLPSRTLALPWKTICHALKRTPVPSAQWSVWGEWEFTNCAAPLQAVKGPATVYAALPEPGFSPPYHTTWAAKMVNELLTRKPPKYVWPGRSHRCSQCPVSKRWATTSGRYSWECRQQKVFFFNSGCLLL